jgi:hypothetical protein
VAAEVLLEAEAVRAAVSVIEVCTSNSFLRQFIFGLNYNARVGALRPLVAPVVLLYHSFSYSANIQSENLLVCQVEACTNSSQVAEAEDEEAQIAAEEALAVEHQEAVEALPEEAVEAELAVVEPEPRVEIEL